MIVAITAKYFLVVNIRHQLLFFTEKYVIIQIVNAYRMQVKAMDEVGVFITILLIIMGIGIVFAVLAVILVSNSSKWWKKL